MVDKLVNKLSPSIPEFKKIFYEGLRRNWTIIILCKCEVFYEGRSKSYLEPGERIIIIKNDKAILIHRPSGYKAVNWQPSGSKIRIEEKNGEIFMISIRERPREKIAIKLLEIFLITVSKLVDTGEFSMYLTEKEMQDILVKNLSIIEKGLRTIAREKELRSGKVDIFAVDKDDNYVIIELKKHRIAEKEVLQLYRYVKELKETNPNVRGIIVGPSIDKDALSTLKSLELEYKLLSLKHLQKLYHNSSN